MSIELNKLCELIVDCPHSTAVDEGIGYPLIRTPNIDAGYFNLEGVHRVSRAVYNKRNQRAIPKPGDLILAREAPAGNVAIIPEGAEFCLGQRTVLIRPDASKVYPPFLNYYLNAPEQRHKLLRNANGATVSHVNMPIIRNLPIELPSMKDQRRVAGILAVYDSLIENNRKRIKLLEEASHRLYKEWFIDLNFPDHETAKINSETGLPEGWKRCQAIDVFPNITIGKTPSRERVECFTKHGIPWFSVSDLGNEGLFATNSSESLTPDAVNEFNIKKVPSGSILLSFKLTIGRCSINTLQATTNEAIAHFKPNNDSLRYYAYLYLNSFPYETLGSTSSISQAINSRIVKALPFVLPSQNIMDAFSQIVSPIFCAALNARQRMDEAREARDRLLPVLMSNEIEA